MMRETYEKFGNVERDGWSNLQVSYDTGEDFVDLYLQTKLFVPCKKFPQSMSSRALRKLKGYFGQHYILRSFLLSFGDICPITL